MNPSPFAMDWKARLQVDIVMAFSGPGNGEVTDAIAKSGRMHLAIMREPWASYIEDGSKRVESRWGKVQCAPHNVVGAGDIIIWKRSGGPVYGISCVHRALGFNLRDDGHVGEMVAQYHASIRIPNDPIPYRGKRFLTIIHLGAFASAPTPIVCKQPGRAGWVVLDRRAS